MNDRLGQILAALIFVLVASVLVLCIVGIWRAIL